jgi:hypothetical protein
LSIAFAGKGQHQDAGGKVVHGAPYTSSKIVSKSISKDGGRASYRGLLRVAKGAHHSKSNVVCDMAFEEFVTDIRRHLLDQFSKEKEGRFPHERYIVLASALSHYVFFTDFILEETRHEQERIGALRWRIEAGTAVTAAAIALLACYRPLYALSNADDILETFKNTSILSEVVKAQISDHEALRQVAVSIRALSSVADKTSLHVREQYEAFPYPRWKTLWKRQIIENWRDEEFCQRLEAPLANRPASILIAGCGTGRDAAIHSMRFPLSSTICRISQRQCPQRRAPRRGA